MFAHIVRRLFIAAPAMLALVIAAFLLIRAAPGGPFDPPRQSAPEIQDRLQHAYDASLAPARQLGIYLLRAGRGDLGPSMAYKDKSVDDILAEGLPITAVLCASALALALLAGTALGASAGLSARAGPVRTGLGAMFAAAALPAVVIGPALMLAFGVALHWLPRAGLYRDTLDARAFVLPVITLALPLLALIARRMRDGLRAGLSSDAVRLARAKGMPEARVIGVHALPIAIRPVVADLGAVAAALLFGSLVVENLFELPGVGRHFIIAALSHDYTTAMGGAILYAALLLVFTVAADAFGFWLDPAARAA